MRGNVPDRRGAALAALLLTALPAAAQRRPFRHYGVPEGLVHDRVTTLHQDRLGYLWLGTPEGLTRFDGRRFVSYGAREGLQNRVINDIAEDRQGRLWVGTNGAGVARLLDEAPLAGSAGSGRFQHYPVGHLPLAERVNALVFDADDTLWCATDHGLFRAPRGAGDERRFQRVVERGPMANAMDALVDGQGRVWLTAKQELFQLVGGSIEAYGPADHVGVETIRGLALDGQGRVLAVNERGLYAFQPGSEPAHRGSWSPLPLALAPAQKLLRLRVDSAGALWISSTHGLIKLHEGRQVTYGAAQGLRDDHVRDALEDHEGHLWIATWLAGVSVLAGEGIAGYTTAEGLPHRNVIRVLMDREGRTLALTEYGGVAEVADDRARLVRGSDRPPFAGADSVQLLQDRRGDWWLGAHRGLFLMPGPGLRPHAARRLGPAEGITATARFQGQATGLYEDPQGTLWCGGSDGLYRLDPARARPPRFERIPLSPPFRRGDVIREMATDAAGRLWLATFGDLGRLVDGRIELMAGDAGLPGGRGGALLFDRRGWLWVGHRTEGVSVSRNPGEARPSFTRVSTEQGLASDNVAALAEDAQGGIWVGTARGLDCLDAEAGRVIRHVGSADGLPADLVHHLRRGPQGELWAATANGLARLTPGRERRERPQAPPVYLTRVVVAGVEQPLPERGARQLPALSLPVGSDNLVVEYGGISFMGRPLRYQYRLEGLDGAWSPPTEMTAVNYARLPAGSYRFSVIALGAEGLASEREATFSFSLPPPVWQRGWFLAASALAVAALVAAAHRARVRRLLALEGIRRQIATDLHDEMGAGLSQVAILSEVARRDAQSGAGDLLGEIAQLARDMRESMADIVWAIDPRKDRLEDLVRRMRQLAFNLLERDGLTVEFLAPPEEALAGIALPPDRRRHLLLVFKEAVHNVARHARASQVRVRLELLPGALRLSVQDDGRGFDPEAPQEGHGLGSLHERARRLSGRLSLASRPGGGTRVEVEVPLRGRAA